jgi:two-component system, NtrC family, sensor histidine kinase PilS
MSEKPCEIETPAGLVRAFEQTRQRSLRYFNLFRLVSASLFAFFGNALDLGHQAPALFTTTAFAYLFAVLALGFPETLRRFGLDRLLALQILIDIVALTLLMWASGGYRSGMAVMIMVVLAGAGLVAQGRMVMFYAALATLAVMTENLVRFLSGRTASEFFQIGVLCMGFFAIALTARLLALRAQSNEFLAEIRGKALASQEAINELIIRELKDGVLVVSGDGQLRQANPQAEVLLGQSLAQGARLEALAPRLFQLLWTASSCRSEPIWLERLGQNRRLLRIQIVATQGGEHLVYLSDHEQLEREAQQTKLAALGRLTASIAHEIRNPLSAMLHAGELLREEGSDPSEVDPAMRARLCRIIADNGRRIDRIIHDVLALGRRDQVHTEDIELAGFIRTMLEEYTLSDARFGEQVAFSEGPLCAVWMDPAHLRQILLNLLNNALRYGSTAHEAVRLWLALREGGDDVALHVADQGPGIPETLKAQVFEPFFTTDARGTGLGLYIARELAAANGASLCLIEEKKGAHFVLTMPLSRPSPGVLSSL